MDVLFDVQVNCSCHVNARNCSPAILYTLGSDRSFASFVRLFHLLFQFFSAGAPQCVPVLIRMTRLICLHKLS